MTSYSLNLQIFCIIFVFFISILGFYLPIYLSYCQNNNSLSSDATINDSNSLSCSNNIQNKNNKLFKFNILSELSTQNIYILLKCCGSGIILGVALVHLLADAVGDLSEYYEYPFALVLAGVGAIFTLGLDQLAHHVVIQINENSIDIDNKNNNIKEIVVENKQLSDHEAQIQPHDHHHEEHHHHHHHSHSHLHNHLVSINDQNSHAAVKALIMEGAVAVHSVIIGFGFGVLTRSDSGAIRILTSAFAIHQFFEGISLGTVASESGLSNITQFKFALVFGLTFPIGAILGLIIRSFESNTEGESAVLIQGFANAVAAGILLHTALSEMIPEDFSHGHAEAHHPPGYSHAHNHPPFESNDLTTITQQNGHIVVKTEKQTGSLKLGMYASLCVGFAIMSILAIWA